MIIPLFAVALLLSILLAAGLWISHRSGVAQRVEHTPGHRHRPRA